MLHLTVFSREVRLVCFLLMLLQGLFADFAFVENRGSFLDDVKTLFADTVLTGLVEFAEGLLVAAIPGSTVTVEEI